MFHPLSKPRTNHTRDGTMIKKDEELNQLALAKKPWVTPSLVSLEMLETASKAEGGTEDSTGIPIGPS